MKILIADDEDYTREGLVDAVNWEEYGISEIMQAVNGAQAAGIARWFLPDIILTDVRMPQMDGIEFATKVLGWNPNCRIIFMSGYMEIEYLKSAIRLAAIDYIEKPIDLPVLCAALRRAVGDIREKCRTDTATRAGREFQQYRLFHLLISREMDRRTVEDLAADMEFPLNQTMHCMILQIPGGVKGRKEQMERAACAVRSSFCAVVGNWQSEKRQYEFILSYAQKDQYRLPSFYQKLLGEFPQARLGIGMDTSHYNNIYNSYRTACMAINCAFYQEKERLFQIDEGILQKNYIEPGIYGEFLQILSGQPQGLEQWFEGLFDRLCQYKYYQKEQVYTLMISFLTAIYKKYPEIYGADTGIWKEEQIPACVREMDFLYEIREFVGKLLGCLKEKQEEQSGYGRIIRGVMDYVAQHYGEEDLSVVQIAEHLHFSAVYLNVLFKQEMKMTLKQYLSHYRLERAKRMLEQDYDKITEIAEKCGYANANYFAKVFREATDLSPAQYRRQKGGK